MTKRKLAFRIIRNLTIGLVIALSGCVSIALTCAYLSLVMHIPTEIGMFLSFITSFVFTILAMMITQDLLNTGNLVTDLLDKLEI